MTIYVMRICIVEALHGDVEMLVFLDQQPLFAPRRPEFPLPVGRPLVVLGQPITMNAVSG